MTSARACWLAAGVLLVSATVAGSGTARPSGATAAAAPFAAAWANVPDSPRARKAGNIVVFGASSRGRGLQHRPDLLQRALGGVRRYERGAPRRVQPRQQGRVVQGPRLRRNRNQDDALLHDQAECVLVLGRQEGPGHLQGLRLHAAADRRPEQRRRGPDGIRLPRPRPDHFTHKGDKQVTFFWKTKDCTTDFPCGPYANWQSLFSIGGLYPSFALQGLDFNKIWTNCICGSDGKPVSDGPFYLANYTPGQGATLKANPYWSGTKPGVAEVDFKFITDPVTEVEAMRTGEVDAIAPAFSQDCSR